MAGHNLAVIGDLVMIRAGWLCPEGSVGFVRSFGADCYGDLILRIDLARVDPMSWPQGDLWVKPDHCYKLFTEKWFEQPAQYGG